MSDLNSHLSLDNITLLLDALDHQESCYLNKKEAFAEAIISQGSGAGLSALLPGMPDAVRDGLQTQLAEKRDSLLKDIELEKEKITLLKAKLILMKGAAIAAEVENDLGSISADNNA